MNRPKRIVQVLSLLLFLLVALGLVLLLQRSQAPTDSDAADPDALHCGEQSIPTITFESIPGISQSSIVEGQTQISNQFEATHNVRFRNGDRVTASGVNLGACPLPHPVLGKVGSPRVAYGAQTATVFDDGVRDEFQTRVGQWFLTDDGVDAGSIPCSLIIDFTKPSYEYSFDLLDVDGGERWRIEAFDKDGTRIYNNSVVGYNQTYDGAPLRVQVPRQNTEIWQIVLKAEEPKGTVWGLAFDNFSPVCAQVEDLPADPLPEPEPEPEPEPTPDPLQIDLTGQVTSVTFVEGILRYNIVVTNPNSSTISNGIVDISIPSFTTTTQVSNGTDTPLTVFPDEDLVRWQLNDIPAGGTVTLTVDVTIPSANYADFLATANVYVDANNNQIGDQDELDDSDNVTLSIAPLTPLILQKSGSITQLDSSNATVTYNIGISNPNGIAAAPVILTDNVAGFVQASDVTNLFSGGAYNFSGGMARWQIPSLAANGSMQVSYTLNVASSNYGSVPNTARVYIDLNSNGNGDSNELQATANETVVISPTIAASLSAQATVVPQPGGSHIINYVLTARNLGDTALVSVRLTEVLDSDYQPGWVSAISNSGTQGGQNITWQPLQLAPDESLIRTYSVTVPSGTGGEYVNVATLYDVNNSVLDTDSTTVNIQAVVEDGGSTSTASSESSASSSAPGSVASGTSSPTSGGQGTSLPDTALFDGDGEYLLLGISLILLGVTLNQLDRLTGYKFLTPAASGVIRPLRKLLPFEERFRRR